LNIVDDTAGGKTLEFTSIILQHQRELLDIVFNGDTLNRNKINLITANKIMPHLTAASTWTRGSTSTFQAGDW
jgi:hypothetical protein